MKIDLENPDPEQLAAAVAEMIPRLLFSLNERSHLASQLRRLDEKKKFVDLVNGYLDAIVKADKLELELVAASMRGGGSICW